MQFPGRFVILLLVFPAVLGTAGCSSEILLPDHPSSPRIQAEEKAGWAESRNPDHPAARLFQSADRLLTQAGKAISKGRTAQTRALLASFCAVLTALTEPSDDPFEEETSWLRGWENSARSRIPRLSAQLDRLSSAREPKLGKSLAQARLALAGIRKALEPQQDGTGEK